MFKRKDPSKLQEQLSKFQSKGFESSDENVWKLEVDKQGNGKAVIRFLPGKTEDDMPFVKLINHGFKRNGKWYIENCTSTHGDFDSCPVCGYLKDNDLYNTDKPQYDSLKRKTSYWANILVISDPNKPENNGKVFKYRFGVKIFDKITALAAGDQDLGVAPVDATCLWEGADFILVAKKVGEHLNYDDSKFKNSAPVDNIDDESVQEALAAQMLDINGIASPDKFKSKVDLTKEFEKVMGASRQARAVDDFDKEMKDFKESKKPAIASKETSQSSSDSVDIDPELQDLLGEL